jgi:capsular polysaccharide biosynthesis protein
VDLWDLTKLLFRRWLISVPILLLTVAGLFVSSQTVKPDYKATGHLIIVSPAQTAGALANAPANTVHNPWEDLGFRALAQTAILKVQSKDVLAAMVKQGFSDNIQLAVDDRTPVITIEVVAHTSDTATATVREIIKNLDDAVSQAQTVYGVQKQSLFTAYPIDNGDSVETVTSTQKRVLAVVAGIGLLGTVAITILVDAYLRRRSRAKTARLAADGLAADSSMASIPAVPAQRTGDRSELGQLGQPGQLGQLGRAKGASKVPGDDALTVTLNALGSRRIGADSPGTGAVTSGPTGAGAGEGERNGRTLTVDYKKGDEGATGAAKSAAAKPAAAEDEAPADAAATAEPEANAPDESNADATVVLPLTSLWGGQDSKRRRR